MPTNIIDSAPHETDTLLLKPKQNALLSPMTKAFERIQSNQHIVQNDGSCARDHLANERTYLAWIRTSLALIAASIVLLKWETELQIEGYLIGILGVVAFCTSTWRYFHVQHLLLEGRFEPNICSILLVMTLAVLFITTAFVMHFRHDRAASKKFES